MQDFYACLQRGAPRGEALRQAQPALLTTGQSGFFLQG
ncbi:hypothetical protein Cabther_A1219 [Chloracidobacterium thermophilum B]|jgi:CHAT domain-containing protein|uniref:Uncharacterized protein n=1 Tax=Chloracidobacterium thermophilum (strain B) TaxID=981222 RepID=G2LDB3_CHLTF|nr:hypothetical protein Cabther_A1219 [Chloracidobacterium thermophilum B]